MLYQVIDHRHIFEPERYFPQCHASTVEFLPGGGLCAAWFAGKHEKAPDVAIWFSREEAGEWSAPVIVADEPEIPCWNPVLLLDGERLLLFYKVGREIPQWRTMIKESADGGRTWSEARELVDGDMGGRGPVKNKCIRLSNGDLLAPASVETASAWDCFTDRSSDGGKSWKRGENVPIAREGLNGLGAIQPTLWQSEDRRVHMLMRSTEGAILSSHSDDLGNSWSPACRTALPNNNCGIDAVRMDDGRIVLAYNPVSGNWAARSPIAFAVSEDDGESFGLPQILDHVPCERNMESAEFSYPAIITRREDIFITYTWKRRTIAQWHIRLPRRKRQ